jgi:putative ABC transport system ATP-binding protein
MHCLAGLDSVTSGDVWVGDTGLTGLPDAALTRLRR